MPLLIVLLIVAPLVELYVIIRVGQAIGLLPTLALLLASALLGGALLRYEGARAWRRFNAALAQRRLPAREVADGLLIALGGALLLAPGFVGDAFGILLLLPPSRAVARRLLIGTLGRYSLVIGVADAARRRRPPGPVADEARHSYDFEASAEEIEVDPPRLPRPEQRDGTD